MTALMGQIQAFAFSYPPRGWLSCNGSLLQVKDNIPLFSLIGNMYGGDGQTTFAIPDIPKDSKGFSYCISITGYFPERS